MVTDSEPRYRLVDGNGNPVGSVYAESDGTLKLQEGSGSDNEAVLQPDGTLDVPSVNTDQQTIDGLLQDNQQLSQNKRVFGAVPGLTFEKSDNNPVLEPAETWEQDQIGEASVVWGHDGELKMLYRAGAYEIGLATSNDGVSWTKDPDNPVLSTNSNGDNLGYPSAALYDGTYYMWVADNGAGDIWQFT